MHLSVKKNLFSIFVYIFQIYINIWTFPKKDDPHTLGIFEITDPERRA